MDNERRDDDRSHLSAGYHRPIRDCHDRAECYRCDDDRHNHGNDADDNHVPVNAAIAT